MNKYFVSFLCACCCFFYFSCSKNNVVESISETELFTLNYGNFEEQLSISDLNTVGEVRYGIVMKDGFFYIVDGSSKKTMELNSYGDLLTLFYNEDSQTKELLEKSTQNPLSVRHQLGFPFDYPGKIAVDSKKCIYTVCTIPRNRQEESENGLLYSQAVLRFTRDGSSVEYIGQQGPGGTPFPYIRNIYTTEKDELVVVSNSNEGMIIYWFTSDGFLKNMIPINSKDVPTDDIPETSNEIYWSLENVIPDTVENRLYVKIDYYSSYLDEESRVQSGINYLQTLLYPLDTETGLYGEPVSIPPYEESVVVDYSRLTYKIPYDFLGVTKNGWKYFIIKTEKGFNIEMIQNESQRILRRQFDINHEDNLFYTMSVSHEGIITALYIDKNKARVVWYRTDTLIDAILKS
ncbi:MAG: hypothetical protein E7060_03965 [Treponema bryantii]|nr:hypothetical protein [Treponema bryantii]